MNCATSTTSSTSTTTWTDLTLDLRLLILSRLPLADAISLSQASPHADHSAQIRSRVRRLKPLRDAWIRAAAPALRCYANPPALSTVESRTALSPADFSKLTALPLGASGLTSLSGISELSQLLVLDASGNLLRHVDEELAQCTQLKVINLGRNRLQRFPHVVLNLPQLRTLHLHHNRITSLPEDWSALVNLHRLGLFDCGIRGPLPEQLCAMLGTLTQHRRTRSANLQMNRFELVEVVALMRRFPHMASAVVI